MPSSTTPAAEDDYENAIGRKEHKQALISADRAEALAAALDLDGIPGGGADLPPGWHWLFFNPFARRSELGPDGHPKRGGFPAGRETAAAHVGRRQARLSRGPADQWASRIAKA
ncbi:hypothetical protein [uncultured Roseibium sp.]|uniref:hypothetical protein n=1 Tax=uncultured Roseibium sp. TaxID=1936171 RepID=UPI0032166CF0